MKTHEFRNEFYEFIQPYPLLVGIKSIDAVVAFAYWGKEDKNECKIYKTRYEIRKSALSTKIETTFDRYYDKSVSVRVRGGWGDEDWWDDENVTVRVPTIPFPVKFAIKRYFQVWGKLTDALFERAFVFESAEKKREIPLKRYIDKLNSVVDTVGVDTRKDLLKKINSLTSEQQKNEYSVIKRIFAKEAYRLLKLGLVRKNQQGEWIPVDIAKIYPEIPLLSSEAVAIIRNRARQLAKAK